MDKDKKGSSKLALMLSLVALILAAIVSVFKFDLWLAGTQWMLVSIVLAVYSVYLNGCNCICCNEKKDGE